MAIPTISSLATLSGIIIVIAIFIYFGYLVWKKNKNTESLKSIDQTLGRMLGESDPDKPTESENEFRPWTCIHCGTANSATENFCKQCGKESRS